MWCDILPQKWQVEHDVTCSSLKFETCSSLNGFPRAADSSQSLNGWVTSELRSSFMDLWAPARLIPWTGNGIVKNQLKLTFLHGTQYSVRQFLAWQGKPANMPATSSPSSSALTVQTSWWITAGSANPSSIRARMTCWQKSFRSTWQKSFRSTLAVFRPITYKRTSRCLRTRRSWQLWWTLTMLVHNPKVHHYEIIQHIPTIRFKCRTAWGQAPSRGRPKIVKPPCAWAPGSGNTDNALDTVLNMNMHELGPWSQQQAKERSPANRLWLTPGVETSSQLAGLLQGKQSWSYVS